MKLQKLLIIYLLFISTISFAQNERKYIRDGNEEYKKENYGNAEVAYKKAITENNESNEAIFNLGDALYQQKKYKDAENQYKILLNREKDKEKLARIYHNLGNAQLQQNQIEPSIEAFKQALKLNPKNDITKYNLAYAQSLQKQQQNQQNQQDKDQQEKKDDQNQNQNNQKQQQQKEDNQQGQKQMQKKDQISKEDAQRLLEAIQNDEQNTQEKLKDKQQIQKINVDKDW